MSKIHPTLLLFAVSLWLTSSALASVKWYVNGGTGSDSNNCLTAATACLTIGHAISLASSGDTIGIATATYTENPIIAKNLKLTGTGPATIVDGGGGAHTIAIESTTAIVTLSKMTIRNGVGTGGGILNWGILTVSNATITGNTAGGEYSAVGAGIYNTGTLTLNNSTVTGNTIGAVFAYGAGVYSSGPLAINNSTITGNTSYGNSGGGGGGIYLGATTAKISNSTIAANGSLGGGNIYNSGGTILIQNSIVANSSSGGNCFGTVSSSGYNLSSDATCNFTSTGDFNNADPLLGPLQNNGGSTQTMALLAGSPAIDAGNPTGCTDNHGHLLKTDQRGKPRPDTEDTSGCDMGAYETQNIQ